MSTLPEITRYRFGSMTIAGKNYTSDLIILPFGKISANWYRKSGHLLVLSDLALILESPPDTLIIGTGASGRMKVDHQTREGLARLNVDFVIHDTDHAVNVYNRRRHSKNTAACFHLTC